LNLRHPVVPGTHQERPLLERPDIRADRREGLQLTRSGHRGVRGVF